MMGDSDCTRRGEGPIPNRYRAPYSNLPPNLEQDETIGNVTPVYPQQCNDQCPVDCETLMLNTDRETIDIDDIVAIPLDIQERLFDFASFDAVIAVAEFLIDNEAEVREMARDRLREGFRSYGSAAFCWSPERRRTEMAEELADAIVYWVSGVIR